MDRGGQMTKEEADNKARQIFQELIEKQEKIIQQAQEDGTWMPGLDSNRELFVQTDNEAKEKLRNLALQIDE